MTVNHLPASEHWFEAGARYAAMLEAQKMHSWASNDSVNDVVARISEQSPTAAKWFEVGFYLVTAVQLLSTGSIELKKTVIQTMQSQLMSVKLYDYERLQVRQQLQRLRNNSNNHAGAQRLFEIVKTAACRAA